MHILAAALMLAQPAPAPAPAAEPVRIVRTRDTDGTHRLEHSVLIPAAPEAVWQAISTAEGWGRWSVPLAWEQGDVLETSYSRDARPGDPSTIRHQIVAREPGRSLT